jgi:hypothetical protein
METINMKKKKQFIPWGLSNSYIDHLGRRLTRRGCWLGVHSCDLLARKINTTGLFKSNKDLSLIVNLALSHQPRGHFVAVAKIKNTVYIFDSLALPIIDSNLEEFIGRMPGNIKTEYVVRHHPTPIQHPKSLFCGFFALAFIVHMQQKRGANNAVRQFFNLFHQGADMKNDLIAVQIIKCSIMKKT